MAIRWVSLARCFWFSSSASIRPVFPIPSVFEGDTKHEGSPQRIGHTEDVRNRFYAISVERRLKHPAVLAICDTARRQLFEYPPLGQSQPNACTAACRPFS